MKFMSMWNSIIKICRLLVGSLFIVSGLIKANDALADPELDALLESLRHCTMPYTCPHGRPTLIEMSYPELEKKFGRTV